MKLTSKHLIAAVAFTIFSSAASTNSYAAKMYKWVDKNGVVSYQDQPPPKNAKVLSEKTVKASSSANTGAQQSGLPRVVIYTVEECAACDYFVTLMKRAQVPHIELPLQDSDRETQSKILAQADSISAPTIFIGDDVIQTSNGSTLRKALTAAGYKIEKDQLEENENDGEE